jgi:hypothetical protein
MKKDKKEKKIETPPNDITRKEALKKAGKYAAVTAAAMFIVLSPKDSQAQSLTPTPGSGW